VKCLVPTQGDGTRPNEVSAAIPGDAVAGNAQGNQRRPLNLTAISATLLPAVWLTRLFGYLINIIQEINLYAVRIADKDNAKNITQHPVGSGFFLSFFFSSNISS
jgi:hypothetical protein